MTTTWYLDGLKTSHVGADEVKKVIDWIKGIYVNPIKKSHGKKDYYLRMDLDLFIDVTHSM